MEIITHSGPVTLLVGRDGGRKRLAFKGSFEVSFHEVLFMIAIHTGVHQLCRVGKIKNSGVFQPLQWLNTRMIEDDKSHVSTGSKNYYRYSPEYQYPKTNPAGIIHSPYWRPEQVIQGRCGRQQGTNPSQIFLVHALRHFLADLV